MKTFFSICTFFIARAAHASSSKQGDNYHQYAIKRCAENGHAYRAAPAHRELVTLITQANAELLDLISHPDSNRREMFIAVCLSAADRYKQHAGDKTYEAFVYARLKFMAGIAQKRVVKK